MNYANYYSVTDKSRILRLAPRSLTGIAGLLLVIAGGLLLFARAVYPVSFSAFLVVVGVGALAFPVVAPRIHGRMQRTLRSQLTVVLAVTAVLPLIFVVAIVGESQDRSARTEEREEHKVLATMAAQSLGQFLHEQVTGLELFAMNLTETAVPGSGQADLDELAKAYRDMAAVALFGPAGQVVAVSPPASSQIDDMILTGPAVARLLASETSSFATSYDFDKQFLFVSVPVKTKLYKAVIAAYPASVIRWLGVIPTEKMKLTVVDSNGRVILPSSARRTVHPAAEAATLPVGDFQFSDAHGDQLCGYAQVRDLKWTVLVTARVSDALAAVYRQRNVAGLILLMFLAASVSVGFAVARRLSNPIEALRGAAVEIAAGNMGVAIPNSRLCEIQQLADAFAEMRNKVAQRAQEQNTAREQLELRVRERTAELEQQRGFLEQLVSTTPVSIAVVEGPDLKFTLVNPTYMSLIARRAGHSEVLGMSMPELFPGTRENGLLAATRRAQETREPVSLRDFEGTSPQHAAQEWWNIDLMPIASHDNTGVLIIAQEITEAVMARLQIEEAAVRTEMGLRQLETVINTMNQGVIISAPSGDIIHVNDAAIHMLGLEGRRTLSSSEGPVLRDMRDMDGNEVAPSEWPLARALRGETIIDWEVCYHKTGCKTPLYASCSAEPVRDAYGEIAYVVTTIHDLTALRSVERAVREREERFRAAVDAFPDVFVLYDEKRRMQFINSRTARLHGMTEAQILGKRDEEVFDPAFTADYVPLLERAITTGQTQRFERTRPAFMGGQTVVVNYVPLFNEHGKVSQVLGITYDITDRKQIEAQLDDTRRKLELLIDCSPLAIVEYDATQVVTRWSSEAQRTFGWTPAEVLKRRVFDIGFLHPDDVGEMRDVVANLTKGHASYASCRSRNIRKDGSIIHCEWYSSAVKDDDEKTIAVISVGLDVTQRLSAEQALRVSEERLRLAQVGARVGAWDWDLKSNEVFWTSDWHDILGLDVETTNVYGDWIALIHPDDRSSVEAALQKSVAVSEGLHIEYRVLAPSGEVRWVSTIGRTMYDGQGKPSRLIGIVQNITSNKEAEAERERLLAAERATRTELESAVKELEAFSYSISHDLRTPLRAIDAFSNILDSEYGLLLPDQARRYLHLVRENSQKMNRLITDILSFSRISRQPLVRQSLSVKNLVEQVIEDLSVLREGRVVHFSVTELPECKADPALLKQVLVNLLQNAIKYTSTRTEAYIEVGHFMNDSQAVYYVRDNGVGFNMKYVSQLFGVFQRLHTDEEFAGTGVGLAIVHRIILRHGGRVWAEAESDKGATFFFTVGSDDPSQFDIEASLSESAKQPV